MIAALLAIFLIVTRSPCRAKYPLSCAMYRPARSAVGRAAIVMSGSSGADAEVSATLPGAAVHAAVRAMIAAAASGATPKSQVFIYAPPDTASWIAAVPNTGERPVSSRLDYVIGGNISGFVRLWRASWEQ